MRNAVLMFCLLAQCWAKDLKQVQVMATHAVTHEARDTRAVIDRGIMGPNTPNRQTESFNLDTVIGEEHVLLTCEDEKGCEAPALGTYPGELKRGKFIRLTFDLPLSHKQVSRWYKVSGSW